MPEEDKRKELLKILKDLGHPSEKYDKFSTFQLQFLVQQEQLAKKQID